MQMQVEARSPWQKAARPIVVPKAVPGSCSASNTETQHSQRWPPQLAGMQLAVAEKTALWTHLQKLPAVQRFQI